MAFLAGGLAGGEALGEGAAWGASSAEGLGTEGEEINSGVIHVGSGHYLRLDPEVIRQLMFSAEVIDAIGQRAQQVVDLANSMAIRTGAQYEFILQASGDNRPQALVKPANVEAAVDDAAHATLLMAAATVGSDPLVEQGEADEHVSDENPGSGEEGSMAPGEADSAALGEGAAGGEAAGGAEIAAVALL